MSRGLSSSLADSSRARLRDGLCIGDESAREAVVEELRESLPAPIAGRLIAAYNETVFAESSIPTLTDMLLARLRAVDPYIRAVSLLALHQRGAATAEVLESVRRDEHPLMRETAADLERRIDASGHLILIEKMIALRSASLFSRLGPEGLAELARACDDASFVPGADLCRQGDDGSEVFILLSGEVEALVNEGAGEQVVSRESAGGFIGELAVLDPAPRAARLRAGAEGARVLRLDGSAFRHALEREPSIAPHVFKSLAQRLRGKR